MKRFFAVMLALMMLAVSGAALAEGTMPSGSQMELPLTLDQETLTSGDQCSCGRAVCLGAAHDCRRDGRACGG